MIIRPVGWLGYGEREIENGESGDPRRSASPTI